MTASGSWSAEASYALVVVTYRRPLALQALLDALGLQTVRPIHVVVVDNDAEHSAAPIMAGHPEATYLPQPTNLGPAGGRDAGLVYLRSHGVATTWIGFVDDDEPPPESDSLERLVALGSDLKLRGQRIGCIGMVGTRFDRRRGLMCRPMDDELVGVVDVDAIGGGHLPLYAVRALDEVGGFDGRLFFGFEELDLGLRLRRRGWRIVVPGEMQMEQRHRHGRIGLGARERARSMPSWRRYYSSRNLITIARGTCSRPTVWRIVLRTGLLSPVRLLSRGSWRPALASVSGTVDGVAGRLGRNDAWSPQAPSATYSANVRADLTRVTGSWSTRSFLRQMIGGVGFRYMFWIRTAQYLDGAGRWLRPARWMVGRMHRRDSFRFGISIPPNTTIGPGFYIGHFGGIVVTANATIGSNCNISQGVTIGSANRGRHAGSPVIGDRVYLGPGAKIVGAVKIGDDVAVGANAVVTDDVVAHAVVVGVPARVISSDGSADYINRCWPAPT